MFRSKLEEKVADLLFELKIDYEYESKKLCYVIQHHYSPDFILPNGRILEVKGYWDSADRRKIRAVIKDNPDIDLRMVFQDPFNATWCDRYDIKWCAYHDIPIDWLI